MPPLEWVVFIDESGDFSRDDEPVCVCGVLVQEGDLPGLGGVLAELLERVYPGARFPPHAAELNAPLAHLKRWMQSRRDLRDRHPSAARLASIADLLLATGAPEAAEFLEAVRHWRPLRYDALQRCDAWLRVHAHADWDLLRQERDDAQGRMRGLLEAMDEVYGPRRCHLMASAEPRSERAGEDRYLRLLASALERLRSLLGGQGGHGHRVRILAAGRWRAGTQRSIDRSDIEAAVAKALACPGPRDANGVALEALPPQAFDSAAHPGLCLADFAANRVRTVIAAARRWREVQEQARARIGLAAEAQPRALKRTLALPVAAAAGLPERAIAAAFAGVAAPALDGVAPGWAREQAERWIAVAGEMR